MDRNTTTEKRQHLTGVWQNGGRSAKLSTCTSINISANLNICASNSPTSPSPKTLPASVERHTVNKRTDKIE